jgi:hypothetical protein
VELLLGLFVLILISAAVLKFKDLLFNLSRPTPAPPRPSALDTWNDLEAARDRRDAAIARKARRAKREGGE